MTLQFFVPGTPAPQGSKTFKGIHGGRGILVESSKALAPWRERVAWAAHVAMDGRTLLSGPITLAATFVMPRPKSAPKSYTPRAIKRPDVDKLARAVLDSVTGTVLWDDAQITDLHVWKRLAEIGETPGVEVRIEAQP